MNKDPDIVPEALPLITLDSKSDVCMAKNGKYTKHTRNISRRVHFVRNGENYKMNEIEWCEGGLKLAEIATKNIGETDLNPRMKYIMVRLDNLKNTCTRGGGQDTGYYMEQGVIYY